MSELFGGGDNEKEKEVVAYMLIYIKMVVEASLTAVLEIYILSGDYHIASG